MFGSDLGIIVFTYLFMTAFEHSLHKVSHYPRAGPLYRWHRLHHRDYHSTRLETDVYQDSGGSVLQNYYLYCIVSMWFVVYLVSTQRVFVIVFTETSLYTFGINYFHECFHTKQTVWNRFAWYRRMKAYHLMHHQKQSFNYNFMDPTNDVIHRRYRNPTASNDSHTPSN